MGRELIGNRTGSLLLGGGVTEKTWPIGSQPSTVWIEAVGGSAANGAVQFSLTTAPSTGPASAPDKGRLTFADVTEIESSIGDRTQHSATEVQDRVANLTFATGWVATFKGSPELQLEAKLGPNVAPFVRDNLGWGHFRNAADAQPLQDPLPTLTPDPGNPLKAKLANNSIGSFKVVFFDNVDGVAGYDPQKDVSLKDFRVVQIGMAVTQSTVMTNNAFTTAPHQQPGAPPATEFRTDANNAEALDLSATIELTGGGGDQKLGLNRAHLGWVGNINDVTTTANYVGGHTIKERITPGLSFPLLDASAQNPANTVFRASSTEVVGPNQPAREIRTVTAVDAPFAIFRDSFPNANNDPISAMNGKYVFEEYLAGFTDFYVTTFVASATVDWTVDYKWAKQAAWVDQGSTVTSPNNAATVLQEAKTVEALGGKATPPYWLASIGFEEIPGP